MSKIPWKTIRFIGRLAVMFNISAQAVWFVIKTFQSAQSLENSSSSIVGLFSTLRMSLISHFEMLYIFGWVGIFIMACLVFIGLFDIINYDGSNDDPYVESYGDDYP